MSKQDEYKGKILLEERGRFMTLFLKQNFRCKVTGSEIGGTAENLQTVRWTFGEKIDGGVWK